MDLIETTAQSNFSRRSIAVASFAGVCNMLSVILLIHQEYLEHQLRYFRSDYISPDWIFLIYLSPLVAVIIFQKIATIAFIYASTLFAVFIGRIYYLSKLYLFGASGITKFDWVGSLLSLLSLISLVVLAAWVVVRLSLSVGRTLKRSYKP